jgi:hypothetical protein
MDEPEPSYAYLLEKNKKRTCKADIRYCTWDEHGNPIPFCFQYPEDKSCLRNTIPPGILFMGCYEDPTCGSHPVGPGVSPHYTPPYAYTLDGKCQPSDLCEWLTDEVAVPACVNDPSPEKCRDKTNLVDCYTEKTCGGKVVPTKKKPPTQDIILPPPDNNEPEPETTNKKTSTKRKPNQTTGWVVGGVAVALVLVALAALYWWKQPKKQHKKKQPHAASSKKQRHSSRNK